MILNQEGVASVIKKIRLTLGAGCLAICCMASHQFAVGQEAYLNNWPSMSIEAPGVVEPIAFHSGFFAEPTEEEEPTIEERLAILEEKYADQSEAYDDLEESYQGLKKTMKTLATSGHGAATLKVNGRIHADLWGFPSSDEGINNIESGDPGITPQDQFGFRRLRFGVKGDLWKTMLYKIEMEFAGGNNSEFRDAFFGWKELPVVQTLLIGNQKRPYGLDHLNSSRYNVFLERPYIIEAFNQDARRLGVVSYGVSKDEAWNWRYGVYNQRLVQDEGIFVSDHWQLEFAGRLANTFWYDEASDGRGYGHWAISGTYAEPDGSSIDDGPPGEAINEARFRQRPEARSIERWLNTGFITGSDNYEIIAVENVWNFGSLQIVGEYQNLFLERDAGTAGGDGDLHFDGGYIYAAYFLTGEHMPWNRSSGTLDRIKPLENFFLVDTSRDGIRGGWGAWQIAYRLSYADLNSDNILGGRGFTHTLGLNWYWNAYARLQFNAIYGEIDDAAISEGDNTRDLVTGITDPTTVQSGNFSILGMRVMVDF